MQAFLSMLILPVFIRGKNYSFAMSREAASAEFEPFIHC